MTDRTISIIMPAFNEGDHIYDNIATTLWIVSGIGLPAEIVAVDDGSSDNTLAEIERAARDHTGVIPARNPYNMGKGMALRTGFDYSSGDIVVFLDADLDLHPSQIRLLIDALDAGPYDVAVTSKHHPDSQLDYPRSRKLASYIYYLLIKTLFGLPVRDTQTGLKAFRREVLANIFHRLLVKKFAYDVELLAAAIRFGYSVTEIPVVIQFRRPLKWGRIRLSDMLNILVDTMAIFYRLRILHYYDIERPPFHREYEPVLVVVRGCPPPDAAVLRLSVDTNTRLACIATDDTEERDRTLYFSGDDQFRQWAKGHAADYDFIGFLGPDYLPIGSWVMNAVRNFADPEVTAVCGPLIPGPDPSITGRAAALISASKLSAGRDHYLHSFRRVRNTSRCSIDNVFIRASALDTIDSPGGFTIRDGMLRRTSGAGVLRYDPDVAVSKPVPPLFLPYISMVARNAWRDGRSIASGASRQGIVWRLPPVALVFLIAAGFFVFPAGLSCFLAGMYLGIVLLAAAATFDLQCMPFFITGMMLEHLTRGVATILGFLAGLFRRRETEPGGAGEP